MSGMGRREFVALLGGAAATLPLAARAQQRERMRRIGVLMNGTAAETTFQSYLTAFFQGLQQLRWNEGQNVIIDVRWNAGDAELARSNAAQLVVLKPDVILAASTTNLMAIQQTTETVPVVFVMVSDPVAQGFVASVAKPGGNLTGFSMYEYSIGGKWVDLLKAAAPDLARVAVMFNPETSPQSKFFMRSVETAAPSLGVQAINIPVRSTADIEAGVISFANQPNGGLILPTDSFIRLRQKLIADLAARHRLPAISGGGDFAHDGGLMYYSATNNLPDQMRQAAGYIDRILKGAKPGDLPIQRADKFNLIINLRTAKALGLTLPIDLLGLANEVIE
jgi:putative tryptophan/tyrosine transport system substrate-binding protein